MNSLIVAIFSVILATGVFNTEPKDSINTKNRDNSKESSETKLAEEKAKLEAQAQAEAEAKAAELKAQAEAKAKAIAEAKAKAAAEAQAQEEAKAKAAAEAQAQAEAKKAQEESKEINNLKDTGINYLRLALYVFGSILVISIGAYFYFRQRDNSSLRSATRTPDSPRRDFRKEAAVEPQEEQMTEEEVKSEPQEEQPTEEEVNPNLKKNNHQKMKK